MLKVYRVQGSCHDDILFLLSPAHVAKRWSLHLTLTTSQLPAWLTKLAQCQGSRKKKRNLSIFCGHLIFLSLSWQNYASQKLAAATIKMTQATTHPACSIFRKKTSVRQSVECTAHFWKMSVLICTRSPDNDRQVSAGLSPNLGAVWTQDSLTNQWQIGMFLEKYSWRWISTKKTPLFGFNVII